MGSLFTAGGIVAAFLAGGVALFAPCCIVFLLPSYLAGAVKNRRWRLLPLTFVFAAGLAVILVPITVGMSLIAATIARYHGLLYTLGGLLMLGLAALALSGRMWSLPSFIRSPDASRGDSASFFALGVFSGIASSCCAPVLAGVMTLSALSSSPLGGAVLGLSYVFGMVFPLFVMALIWDAAKLSERTFLRPRPVTLRLGHRSLRTSILNIVVAIGFTVMGTWILILAAQGAMTSGPEFVTGFGTWLGARFATVQAWVAPIPEWLQGVILLLIAAVFIAGTLFGHRRTPHDEYANGVNDGEDRTGQETVSASDAETRRQNRSPSTRPHTEDPTP
ncbi:MAG: cytochrome c biogenesis CcdA family protein [Pseudoclavibacter sp.]